jgi:hypothetical protein
MSFNPLFGEIWKVQFQPDSIGKEIDAQEATNCKPQRPAVILTIYPILDAAQNRIKITSSDFYNIRLVVPFTGWQPYHDELPWYVVIQQNSKNGLTKKSSANIYQARCCDLMRFEHNAGYLGKLNKTELQSIIDRFKICIGDGFVL